MKFPRWWGDRCPGEVKAVYKGKRRTRDEAQEDRSKFYPRFFRYDGDWWCTNGHLAIRVHDAPECFAPVHELPPKHVERFAEQVQMSMRVVQSATFVEVDEENACRGLRRISRDSGVCLWLRADYVAMVEKLTGVGVWACGNGTDDPGFLTKGQALVAVVMGVNR